MKIFHLSYSRIILALSLFISISNIQAATAIRTYSGTEGVLTTFFSQCTGCHSASGTGQAPYWDIYSNVDSNYGTSVSGGIYQRVFIDNDAPMYSGNAVNQPHLTAWNTAGRKNYDDPYIATGSHSGITRDGTNSYHVDLSWNVNDNGDEATYTAYRSSTSNTGPWTSSGTATDDNGKDGGDASTTNDTATRTISGLSCGTQYWYYLFGNNNAAGNTSGGVNSFTTTTCNTGATYNAQSAPGATEDSAYSWTPTKVNGSGTNTYSYSFTSTPSVSGGNTLNRPAINAGTGQITWTPTEGNTSANFTVQVSDAAADTNITDTLAATINVTAVNDNNPVITTVQGSIPGATEDSLFSIQLAATDVDGGDTQTWDIIAEDHAGTSITTGGLLTWTPPEGTGGSSYNVTVRVRDAVNNQGTKVFSITVAKDQVAPIISGKPIGNQAATEDSPFSIDLDATDTDSPHTHTWAIISPVSLPDNMGINNSGVLTWTPSSEANMTQAVTVRVTDDGALTDTTSFNINVTAIVDNLPVITTSSLPGGTEEIAYSSFLAFTDADTDGDSWTWSVVSGPTVQPSNGAPANAFGLDSSTGEVTWTPANNETSLSFTARLTDSRGGAFYDEQALTINVSQTNDAPVITNVQAPEGIIADQAATENSQFSIDIDASDPDAGDTQTWTIRLPASKPDNMSIDTNGVLTWTPTTDVSLTQSVTVRVTDSGNLNDEVTFNINVTPVIDNTPVITTAQGDLPTNTREDIQAFSHTLTWTDADTEGDGWTWSLTAQDDPQMAINSSTGEITWAPVEGERGDFDLTARVTDDGGFWDEIALVITVLKDNDAPTISGKPIANQSATEDILFTLDINKTDPDIGDTEAWVITSPAVLPDDMAISNTGVLTWTPSEGVDRSQAVTVQITDEGGLTDSTSFTIDVDSVNDAPVITQVIPNVANLIEHSDFIYTVLASDSDPQDNTPDLNSNLIFSITNVNPTPNSAGPQIASNGQITWTPGDNDARTVNPAASSQDYVISVSVADGGEDAQAPAMQNFTITVVLLDTDVDTVPDYEDNCPIDANTQQENNESDSQGDICDPDDDNDGVSDIAEIANPPMDSFLDTDASGDVDSDGLTNLAEFNICTGSDINSPEICPNISIDSVPPTIVHNGNFNLVAKGYTTFVDFKATASDGNDGAVPVYADITEKNLRPGDHVITWTAQDQIPNIANEEQTITIHPIVTLGGSQIIAENASGDVVIHFNGDVPAADFPLYITYSVSGTSSPSDYLIDLSSPITINDASEIIDGTFTLYVDALNGDATESNETLVITLNTVSGGPVLGNATSHQIIIVDGQVAPTANLVATQSGIDTNFIFGDQGIVTINANEADGNGNVGGLIFDWGNTDTELLGTPAGNSFSFDPSVLVIAPEDLPYIFKVAVSISDGIDTINKQLLLSYQSDTLSLASSDTDGDGINDDIEGLADNDGDGIPNYLDAYDNPTNLLFTGNAGTHNTPPKFIQTESGTTISLGEFSLANNTNTPKLNMTALNNLGASINDSGFVHFGAIYEFIITGLSQAQSSARVVIPLENAIPPGAIYRKFNGSEWFTFVEGANDSLSSATSDENGCPEPGSESYEAGLLAFRDCVQLQLSDGGANDNDGEINGTIVDPGGLALSDNADIFEPTKTIDESGIFGGNGPASSGTISLWFSLFLALFASFSTLQRVIRKRQ